MLPDFPKTKRIIRKNFREFLHARVQEHAQLPITRNQYKVIHEGDGMLINYSEDKSHDTPLKNVGGEYTVSIDDLIEDPNLTFRKLEELAKTIAENQGRMVFDTISQVTEKFGNVTKRKGEVTPEDIIEMYQKLKISFNDDGTPNIPTIYCGTDMIEPLKAVHKKLFEDPELTKRFNEIINTQKQEWIDRENNRKLVD